MTRWLTLAWLLAAVAFAVACDSNSMAASEVGGPDATDQLVHSTTTVVEDVGSKSSDDIRAASATVTAATEGDDAVVDGFCPVHPDGDIVRPTKANAKSPNGWELSGTVKSDSVVLKWSEPEVAGVSGYVVTRHSSAPDLSRPHSWTQVVEGSVRAFAVKGRTADGEWADTTDIEPCTNYRYRVFPITPDGLGLPTAGLEIWSLPAQVPAGYVKRHWSVTDVEAWPTRNGLLLTWKLPADSSNEGILIRGRSSNHGDVIVDVEAAVLPPDTVAYSVLTRGDYPWSRYRYCYEVGAFHAYGTQTLKNQRACISQSELVHCRMTSEEATPLVGPNPKVTIEFRGCEEASTETTRHELTVDGFEVSKVDHECVWEPSGNEGILKCEFDDSSVKPDTWYIYELSQTLAYGREFKSLHEVHTSPW